MLQPKVQVPLWQNRVLSTEQLVASPAGDQAVPPAQDSQELVGFTAPVAQTFPAMRQPATQM
jgi:hypothetical protein